MRLTTLGLKLRELGSTLLGLLKFRKIPQFNGVDQYSLIPGAQALSGDFEIEVRFLVNNNSSFQYCIGSDIGLNEGFGISSDSNSARFIVNGSLLHTTFIGGVTPNDGKLHTWKGTRVGSVGTFWIDGILQKTDVVGTGDVNWNEVGGSDGLSNLLYGSIDYIKVSDSLGNVNNWTLNSGSNLYELAGGVLGTEILSDPEFLVDVPDGGSSTDLQLGAGVLVTDGAIKFASFTNIIDFFKPVLEVGAYYRVDYEISGVDVIIGKLGGQAFPASNITVGKHSIVLKVIDQTSQLGALTGSSVEYLRIKKLPNDALLYINRTTESEDWPSYYWNNTDKVWSWRGSLVTGSVLQKFIGSTQTPLDSSLSILGSAWNSNMEGLLVEEHLSGIGYYTYNSAPDGVNITLEVLNPESVSTLIVAGRKFKGVLPDPKYYPALTVYQFHFNLLTCDMPDFSSNPALSYLYVYNNADVTGRIKSLTGTTSLTNFRVNNTGITGYDASVLAVSLVLFYVHNTAISAVEDVDQMLADLRTSHELVPRVIDINMSGGTIASPSGGINNLDYLYLTSHATFPCTVSVNV